MNYPILKKLLFNLPFLLIFISETSNADNIDSLRIAIDNIMKNGNKALISDINGIKFKADTIRVNHYLTLAYNVRNSNYDSLFYYSQKAIASSLDLADLKSISRSVQMLGRYYVRKENYPKAGECYLLSLAIEEKNQNARRTAELNDELGNIYYYEEVFEKALIYHSRALKEYEKEHDTLNSAIVYGHIGSLYNAREFCERRTDEQKTEDFNQALIYFKKSILLGTLIRNQNIVINNFSNIAVIYNKQKHPEKALPYEEKAVEFYRANKNSDGLSNTLHIMGGTYYRLKRYKESIKAFDESLKIGIANNSLDGVQYLYESMAHTYSAAEDYKNAYAYYIKYMTVKDSVSNQQKAKELFEFETRYESQKKENEIIRLTLAKRVKNIFLYALSGLILTLCILIYFIMKNTSNKKLIVEQNLEIKERQILEMEKERQLIATKSVLKGEETERSRMARDLHDGLGGLLSGVKINLSSMKGNSIISKENANIFDQALKLLDTSITELRRVAHSLMPETLNYYGLKTAFSDFISELNGGNDQILSFRFSGEDIRYDSQLELTLYRIAQELVNNALKHSEAKNIDLQLITEVNRVCVQVIDDGKGFDVSAISATGKGLLSIRERVVSNNGRFDLESSTENGTEATVEFML